MHNPVKKKSLYKYVNAIWYNSTIILHKILNIIIFSEYMNNLHNIINYFHYCNYNEFIFKIKINKNYTYV